MWKLYDELLDAIPDDIYVRECQVGINWTMVRSQATGMAMTIRTNQPIRRGGDLVGMKVRELAEYVKSWNFMEASIGLAAINSVLNTRKRAELYSAPLDSQVNESVIETLRPQIQGKKVTVVGHFPAIERLHGECQLSILERCPEPGDLPDPACEYILPEQDYVFITSTTLINKTLPRLLQICKSAKVLMVGPSTPLYPGLFEYGVDTLAGSVVVDEALWAYVREGGIGPGIFKKGCRPVTITRTPK